MSHPQQDQCADEIRELSRKGKFRIVQQGYNCHFFASDEAAQQLKDRFGIASSALGEKQVQMFKDYDLGNTPHYIPRESLTEVIGKCGLGDALRGVESYIPKQTSGAALGA